MIGNRSTRAVPHVPAAGSARAIARALGLITLAVIVLGSQASWSPLSAASKSPSAPSARSGLSPEAAMEEVSRAAGAARTDADRIDVIARMAYLDPELDPAVIQAARVVLRGGFPPMLVERTSRIADLLGPGALLDLLDVYETIYPNLKGFSYQLNNVVATATAFPDRAVRAKASSIVARFRMTQAYFNLRRRCNRSSGEDRLEAIRTIGALGDGRAAWFLPALLDSSEPGIREAVYEALSKLGRSGTLALKERLTDPDPVHRRLALQALMPLAEVDDLPSLYAFAEANPGLDEPVKTDLFRLIARLEVIRDSGIETPKP